MPGGGLFLAYTRDDARRVEQVARWLEAAGLHPWSDVEIEAGVDWELAIADRLRDSDAVVVFVSPAAEHASWVQREIDYAKASGTPIVPLLIEGEPSPRLANIQHVDLRWATSLPAALIETLRRLVAREDAERLSSAATEVLKASTTGSWAAFCTRSKVSWSCCWGTSLGTTSTGFSACRPNCSAASFTP
jgi:hypothetical protein